MPKVLFNSREPKTGKIRKPVSVERYKKLRERGRLIPKLKQRAMLAKQRAEYLASPKGLARETIRGIPAAAGKVGKKLLEYSPIGLAGRGIERALRIEKERYAPKTEEKIEREKRLQRIKELIEEYKERFPKFKIPKEFKY